MIVITDLLKGPFDEGAKIATRNLIEQIEVVAESYVISINTTHTLSCVDKVLWLNKLLFSLPFYKSIQENNGKILYVPESSATLFSFVRAKLLNFFTGKDVYLMALQPRKYSSITKCLVKSIQPNRVITQSNMTGGYLTELGIKNTILPLGVDDKKYRELDLFQKELLRKKNRIEPEKIVLLHVGHIQKSRNLDWLIYVKNSNPELEILIVVSAYNQDDEGIYTKLIKAGIRIVREYTPNMEELYNLADYYVFPVLRNDGAIATPLSVLEAMACNLPIITTRFGSLPDTFSEANDFHYVNSAQEITEIVGRQRVTACKNREKISPFTWEEIAKKLVGLLDA